MKFLAILLTVVTSLQVNANDKFTKEKIVEDICSASAKHCAVINRLDLADEGQTYLSSPKSYLIRGAKGTEFEKLRIATGYNSNGVFFFDIQ